MQVDHELVDGTIVQAAMDEVDSYAEMIDQEVDGVIWRVIAEDEQDNVFGEGIEYDVLLATRRLVRVKSNESATGWENGSTTSYMPTTATTDGSILSIEDTPLEKMNGDHVRLRAMYDRSEQLTITGRLPHPNSSLPKVGKDQLPFTEIRRQGSIARIEKTGKVVVDVSNAKTSQEVSIKGKDISLEVTKDKIFIENSVGSIELSTDKLLAAFGNSSVKVTNAEVQAEDSTNTQTIDFVSTASLNQVIGHFMTALDNLSRLTALTAPGTNEVTLATFATSLSTILAGVITGLGYPYIPPPAHTTTPVGLPGGIGVKADSPGGLVTATFKTH